MVPTRTGKQGKPGKMGRHFPVREKSGNFVKTGKVREIYLKYWENQKKLYWKIEIKCLKSQGKMSASNSENPANMVAYFRLKKYWKTAKKNWKSRGKVTEIC